MHDFRIFEGLMVRKKAVEALEAIKAVEGNIFVPLCLCAVEPLSRSV